MISRCAAVLVILAAILAAPRAFAWGNQGHAVIYEIAFLLGCRDGGKLSRYERFQRAPNLESAAALELVFGVPVRELFAGVYEDAGRVVRRRSQLLARRLRRRAEARTKLARVKAIADRAKGTEEYRYEALP